MRLGFAIASHMDADILLLDEVFAVGDEAFQRKCMDRVLAFKRGGRDDRVRLAFGVGRRADVRARGAPSRRAGRPRRGDARRPSHLPGLPRGPGGGRRARPRPVRVGNRGDSCHAHDARGTGRRRAARAGCGRAGQPAHLGRLRGGPAPASDRRRASRLQRRPPRLTRPVDRGARLGRLARRARVPFRARPAAGRGRSLPLRGRDLRPRGRAHVPPGRAGRGVPRRAGSRGPVAG